MGWDVTTGEIIPQSRGAVVKSAYVVGSMGSAVLIVRGHGTHWHGLSQWGARITPEGVVASDYATFEAQGPTVCGVLAALVKHYEEVQG